MAKHIHIHISGKAKDEDLTAMLKRKLAELEAKQDSLEKNHANFGEKASLANEISVLRKKISETNDASNHLGEKEYYTYRRWKEACKAANPAVQFEGNEEICNAKPGVGEWDGEKGSVYAKKTGDAAEFKPMDNQLLQKINQSLTQASRDAETLVSNNREGEARGAAQRLESLIDEARNYCFQLRR